MKKVILVLTMVFLSGTGFAYTDNDLTVANSLAADGIIKDHSGDVTKYRLDDTISRQEVVGIALKISDIPVASDHVCKGYFSDTTFDPSHRDAWVCASVETAADEGLVSRSKSRFRPRDSITRAEALAIMMNASGIFITKNVTITYDDQPTSLAYKTGIPQWQIDLIESAHVNNIIDAYADGSAPDLAFLPNALATRAEVFAFAARIKEIKDTQVFGKVISKNGYSTYTSASRDFKVSYPEGLDIVQEEIKEEGFDIAVRAYAEDSSGDFLVYEIDRVPCDNHCYDNYEEFYANTLVAIEGMGYKLRPASEGVSEFTQKIDGGDGKTITGKGYLGVVVTPTHAYTILVSTSEENFETHRAELLKILGSFELIEKQ